MSLIKSRVFILLIPLLSAFLSLEVGLRIIKKVKLNKPIFEKYKEIFSNERDKDYVFWHKPNVNVYLDRGENSYTFTSNKYGHRSDSDQIQYKQSIVFLGDSIIEGATVENNETLSSQIYKDLNYPTINLGLAASNTVQEYFLLKEKYKESFGMKLLILGFCVNDIEQNIFRRAFNPKIGNWEYFDTVIVDTINQKHFFKMRKDEDHTFIEFLKKSEAITFLYRNIYLRFDLPKIYKTKKKQEIIDSTNKNTLINTEYFLKKIRNFADTKGSKTLVLLFPTKKQINEESDNNYQKKLKKILENNNIEYYDPLIDLINYKKELNNKNVVLYSDNVHPNKNGTEIISKYLIKYLKKNDYKFLN